MATSDVNPLLTKASIASQTIFLWQCSSVGASSERGARRIAGAHWLLMAYTMLVTTDDGNLLRGGPGGGMRGLGGCCVSADW
jgi:hypothetical protein